MENKVAESNTVGSGGGEKRRVPGFGKRVRKKQKRSGLISEKRPCSPAPLKSGEIL